MFSFPRNNLKHFTFQARKYEWSNLSTMMPAFCAVIIFHFSHSVGREWCLLKMVIITLPKQLYQFTLTLIHECPLSKTFTIDRYYLYHFDKFCFTYFLEYMRHFSDVKLIIYIFLIHILCPSTFSHVTNIYFKCIISICYFGL